MRLEYVIIALLLAGFIPLSNAQVIEEKRVVVSEMPAPPQPSYGDFTKLSISPKQKHLELKPGEEREFKVKVKNREEEPITLEPHLVAMPFGESLLDESWVTITPEKAEAGAGDEQEFKVVVSIPEDAEIGYYSVQIAFTNETLTYPTGFPRAINALNLNIKVWKEPTVKIVPSFIHDRVEAGKSYTYEIEIENTGSEAVSLRPRFGTEEYSGCRGMGCPSELDESWVSITSPGSIAPGTKATVKIQVAMPQDAKGRYEGKVDLGIEDPARAYYDRWWKVVTLSLEVWQQPTAPFEKEFEVSEGIEKLTLEIGASNYAFLKFASGKKRKAEEPNFEVTLISPRGEELKPKQVKSVLKGRVDLGSWYSPPWEVDSKGIYTVQSTEYMASYTIEAPEAGKWKARIMPFNTSSFEYSIILE